MPSGGAEDTRLVSADLVPEVEQVALELLARDDRTLRVGQVFGNRHARPKSVLSPLLPPMMANKNPPERAFVEADDEARTRDPQLGKLNRAVSAVSFWLRLLPSIPLFMRVCGRSAGISAKRPEGRLRPFP